MKKIILSTILLASLLFTSCTDNHSARNYGGTEQVKLLPNHKFVNATWKQDNLWIVTQDTLTGKFYFKEKSSFGIWEGTIEIY